MDSNSLTVFAMQNPGDSARGKLIFSDEKRMICAKCHTTDGQGGKAGPDLSAIGDKFSRRELIRSVLEPSSTIAVGYGTTVVTTRDGEEHQGVLKQATESWIELMGGDGLPKRIQTADIKEQHTTEISLMPEGLVSALQPQEFSDLIAYLESLHQRIDTGTHSPAMPDTIPQSAQSVGITPFFGPAVRLNHPLWFGEVPGFTNRFVVLEHGGKSWVIERTPEGDQQSSLVDLSGEIRFGGATGLLGLAFHPHFAENHKYYLQYQVLKNGRIVTLLMERQFAADFKGDAGVPPRELMEIEAVTQDHNGGSIVFGPDRYLYFGMGDTGPQGDPQGHGQNLGLLLGKMLRLDVDHSENGRNYAIPKDNPFFGNTNARPEIWAYGFREPWRYSFDSLTGDLWVGDVGQDRYEEISLPRAGENLGWNVFEGVMPFSNRYRRPGENYIPPILSYSHRAGVSVTGGYVYRGHRAPAMYGRYICGDFQTQRIWALTQTNRVMTSIFEIGLAPSRLVSFAQDHNGELYIVGYDSGGIYQLDLAKVDPSPRESRIVAQTSEQSPVLWRYTLQAPTNGWNQSAFDDSSWKIAPGGFGTTGTPGAIVRTDWHTDDIWLRREFTFAGHAPDTKTRSLALRIHHDEDVEVYLNGVPLTRQPHWTTGYIELPLTPEAARALRSGRNMLALHCHQVSGGQYIDAGLIEYEISSAKPPTLPN